MHDLLIRGGTIVDGLGMPFWCGDIAVEGGRIVDMGERLRGSARETIDAGGLVVTPGFIDPHTHFDAQVHWDDLLEPSSGHGVTTVVMGNCGVGMAPVRPGGEAAALSIAKGVEDIEIEVMQAGIDWQWEGFPEWLDYLDRRGYALDVGTQVPHGTLRAYVMGERAMQHEKATSEEIATMARLVEEGLRAGALGFGTSRKIENRTAEGSPIPGAFAEHAELEAIAAAMRRVGRGVIQMVPRGSSGTVQGDDVSAERRREEWLLAKRLSLLANAPALVSLLELGEHPQEWRDMLALAAGAEAEGARVRAAVGSRAPGVLSGLQTYHLFERRPGYLDIAHLPLAQRVAAMRRPEVRARILDAPDIPPAGNSNQDSMYLSMKHYLPRMYLMGDPIDWEPDVDRQVSELAARRGVSPEAFIYDYFVDGEGLNFVMGMAQNYHYGNADAMFEMLNHPQARVGLDDAGAHAKVICDASAPTMLLTFWARDRRRGPMLPLEQVVRKQTSELAQLYGLSDRGALAIGKRADINLMDFEKLSIGQPRMVDDLPAGGRRLLQSASGYVATFVNGVRTRADGRDTGARPGRVVRGGARGA
jgi:N-acyl-D-aspartate/D-glutamate deacylase